MQGVVHTCKVSVNTRISIYPCQMSDTRLRVLHVLVKVGDSTKL